MPGGGQGAAEQPPARQRALSVGFPSDVVIHVTVCTDFASQGSCCVPSRVPENPHTTYALLTQGVYFRVLTAKDPPVVLRSSFEWLDAIELLAAVETRQERPVLSLALATGLCGVALGGWSVGPQSSHPRQLVPAQTLDFRDASGRYFASLSLASDGGVILSLEDVAQFSDGGTFVAYPYLISTSSTSPRGTSSSATEPLLGPHSS